MKHPLFAPLLLVGLLALAACQSTPEQGQQAGQASAAQAQSTLNFVDYAGFDRSLHAALSHNQPVVTVVMYDKVSPNNTPDRLQKWLNAVERNGGRVDIQPPPGDLAPKSPMALISLIGGLWNAIKVTSDLRDAQMTHIVKGHDAVISLERNDAGQIVIGKILFKKPNPS